MARWQDKPDDELTGLQLAKRYGVAYVSVRVDKRHVGGGSITVDGGAAGETLRMAEKLVEQMVDGDE